MSWIKEHFVQIISILCVILIGIVGYLLYKQYTHKEEIKQPIKATSEQVTDPNYLENKLDMKKQDAQTTTHIIEKAQNNTIPPVTNITIHASTPEQATDKVIERIEQKDPTLPKEVLKESDRTVIAPQPDNKDYQVGVYKINTYRNWYAGTGIGVHNNKTYIPIAVGRQYSKDKSIEFQVNYSIDKNKIDGGQVMHYWHFK